VVEVLLVEDDPAVLKRGDNRIGLGERDAACLSAHRDLGEHEEPLPEVDQLDTRQVVFSAPDLVCGGDVPQVALRTVIGGVDESRLNPSRVRAVFEPGSEAAYRRGDERGDERAVELLKALRNSQFEC
jgi:hypothetical protein